MRSKFYINLLISFSLLTLSYSSIGQEVVSHVDDFTAKFNIIHDDDVVGKAVQTLHNLPDGNVKFTYKTDIEWLIFSDHRNEVTTNKIVNGLVIPLTYKSTRTGTGKDKSYEWLYDASAKTAINVKKNNKVKNIDWPEGLQSKLSYHLQSRLNLINNHKDFNFKTLSSSAKIKEYKYEYIGKEELMLPYGVIEAIKLKRKKPNSKQVTYAWFAPSLNYMMVKLHQIESNFQQFEAQLVSFEPPLKVTTDSK